MFYSTTINAGLKKVLLFASVIFLLCSNVVAHDKDRKISEIQNLNLYNKNDISHPLVCVKESDHPKGKEGLYVNNKTNKVIHIVFPNKKSFPTLGKRKISVKGYEQHIKNIEHYKIKKVQSDYKYFVALSWEYQ